MRFKNYLDDAYIGLVDRSEKNDYNDKEVKRLLKELNRILERYYKKKDIKFGIIGEYKSPSEVLNLKDEKKMENITRRWMNLSEQLEEIKERRLKSLQSE